MHVAAKAMMPSLLEVLLVVHVEGSMPQPPVSSVQFQVTVTSVVFQPAALAAGDWVGLAVGAVVSGVVYVSSTGVVLAMQAFRPATSATMP